jgi:hypothetical protein
MDSMHIKACARKLLQGEVASLKFGAEGKQGRGVPEMRKKELGVSIMSLRRRSVLVVS